MKDLTQVTKTITYPSLSKEEMIRLYKKGKSINGFIGGVEVDTAVLQEEVPDTFEDSSYTDEEGVEHRRTWQEYARTFDSVNKGKSLMQFGHCDINGNYARPLSAAEYQIWMDHWVWELPVPGVPYEDEEGNTVTPPDTTMLVFDHILTKSEMTSLIPIQNG